MFKKTHFLSLVALLAGGGCASHDSNDRFVLGEANRRNIALQSVRDASQPNKNPVVGQSGRRGVSAVERLNNGEIIEPRSEATTGAGGGGGGV